MALIDTTGSFSPLRLRNVVVSRILEQSLQPAYQQSGYVYERSLAGSTVSDQSVVEEATSLLDRVKVMRVFDFAGVVEAVSEIGQIWEKGDHNADGQLEAECQKGNKIIDDSETDDVSCDNDNGSNASSIARAENYDEQPEDKSCCISMVIIDTITNIASSMVQRNQTQGILMAVSDDICQCVVTDSNSKGQAMLTSFMGSLHHLTTRRHICTLLVNMAVGLDSSSHLKYQRKTGNNASIFASVLGKPALGRIYKHHIDTSVFLSFIPETQEDAEIAYGGAHAAKWKKVSVCEVLSDRYGGREGQWACFEIVDEVRVKNLS